MSKIKKHYIYIYILIGFLALTALATTLITNAAPGNTNGERVALGSELTYFLTINYDAIDKDGTESNSTTIKKIDSDIIEVEDKLPDGLTFQDFIKINDDVFRATKRDNTAQGSCNGYVIDDTNDPSYTTGTWDATNTEYTYHGLHYNKDTNLITFKIKELTAGCQLSVGIVTKVPDTVDDPNTTNTEIRRDFYNTASIKDGNQVSNSNTLHNYIFDETKDEEEEEQNGNVKNQASNTNTKATSVKYSARCRRPKNM